MTYIEETVSTNDGLRLYVRRREAESPRAEIVLVHGFGEHSGRYSALIEHLTSRSYTVTAYDHRGHGLSDGQPGHIESFNEYEEDLDRVLSSVRSRTSSRHVFIIGHSMGGLVTLRYVTRKRSRLSGAVVSAPLIAAAAHLPVHKLMIARVGARVAPRMRFDIEINPADLSRDEQVGRAYVADPLVHGKVSARGFAEATRAMEEVMRLSPQITLPLLVMHGTDDRLASVEATRQLFEQVGSNDKKLVIYPGYYHELFNEPEKQEIFDMVTGWLDARAG